MPAASWLMNLNFAGSLGAAAPAIDSDGLIRPGAEFVRAYDDPSDELVQPIDEIDPKTSRRYFILIPFLFFLL